MNFINFVSETLTVYFVNLYDNETSCQSKINFNLKLSQNRRCNQDKEVLFLIKIQISRFT